jgi:hypothetical protein
MCALSQVHRWQVLQCGNGVMVFNQLHVHMRLAASTALIWLRTCIATEYLHSWYPAISLDCDPAPLYGSFCSRVINGWAL